MLRASDCTKDEFTKIEEGTSRPSTINGTSNTYKPRAYITRTKGAHKHTKQKCLVQSDLISRMKHSKGRSRSQEGKVTVQTWSTKHNKCRTSMLATSRDWRHGLNNYREASNSTDKKDAITNIISTDQAQQQEVQTKSRRLINIDHR